MGIFSFFSKDTDEEEESEELLEREEEPEARPSGRVVPSGQLYEGMRIDVTTKEGARLLSGQITKRTADTLTLNRLPGELSFKISPLGADVSLSGYDKRLVPVHLSGTVEESNRVSFKVKNLKVEHHDENRDNFRLPYTAPVSLYREDDTLFRHSEQCELVDISTGGCCIESEYVHIEDEVIRVRIKLEDYAPLTFLGQVVRCSEQGRGKFRYGILFAQLTEQETTTLNKTLYNLQMGVRDTHMRKAPGEPGHW